MEFKIFYKTKAPSLVLSVKNKEISSWNERKYPELIFDRKSWIFEHLKSNILVNDPITLRNRR